MPKSTKARGGHQALRRNYLKETELAEPASEASATTEQADESGGDQASALSRPNKSDTRDVWNEYAESLGIEDAAELQNKRTVIRAVEELDGA